MRHVPGPALPRLIGILVLLLGSPALATADWVYSPFIGGTFGGSTSLPDLEQGAASSQLIFGGSAGWWTPGIFGLEADFAYAPNYFESDGLGLGPVFTGSNVTTFSLGVVVATPVSVTRESLRPYLIGGIGLMHSSIDEGQNILPEIFGRAKNSIGMNIGGGVVGFLTQRTGVRFEVRQFRSLERDEDIFTRERSSLLSFWRITAGVVIRR